jgi:beta-galactosidase
MLTEKWARSCSRLRNGLAVPRFSLGLLLVCANAFAQSSGQAQQLDLPGPGKLFVGTCYQPVDRTPQQIVSDIALMKAAHFTMVRIGDLSWDAIEPRQGVFDFTMFDSVVSQLHAAGIRVLFDIGGLPAPTWLHSRYPSVNVVNQYGAMLYPADRYMEDISDPMYREQARILAEHVIRHYAHNPAIIAFGYDNEIGNGFMSYSPADRLRFIAWLRGKYGSIDNLNAAWATQRWSRHLNSFDQVELPYGDGPGPPERYLELHRFWSNETIAALEELDAVRRQYAPGIPTASNLWPTAGRKGFNYFKAYKQFATYGTEGFYPGDPLSAIAGVLLTRGDLQTPTWYDEFVTGGPGNYGGPRGIIRMWAYLGLLNYGQTYLAWTFNTHRGGEEQALFGLLDHDGTPSWKYDEFKQIATEFARLQNLGFPRSHKPQVAIAYSFASRIASAPPGGNNSAAQYFTIPYEQQVDSALEPFFDDNIDAAMINVAYAPLDYRLLIIPADYVMDAESAAAIRAYVRNGGTAIMTAFSAKVDEHSQWFGTALPGRLSDVFGIRTSEFYRSSTLPEVTFEDKTLDASESFYEILEPHTARVVARFSNIPDEPPALTENDYGKGHAYYLAVPAQGSVLGPVVESLYTSLGIERGPVTPDGVYARVVDGRTLYVNTTSKPKAIRISGTAKGLLTGRSYRDAVTLPPYQVDLIAPAP